MAGASKKRDRWDSSSEEENDAKESKEPQLAKKKDTKKDSLPTHNPLLSGCRSVYDTYERLARVSEGTYGIVYRAKDLATQEIVALKQIKFDKEMIKEGFPLSALREVSVLLAMSHENVVNVREMVVGDALDQVFMVMEFMEFDLKEGLSRFRDALAQSELKSILLQIVAGMQHMHSKWLLHRDMKTSNILVHRSGRVCLCDFGLARSYQEPQLQQLTQLVVTLWYRSPELLFGETRYGPAVDMWSIGCIFGELICKDSIMQGQGELDQIDKIFEMVGVPTEENWPLFKKLPNAGLLRWKPRKREDLLIFQKFPVNKPVSSTQAFLDVNGFDLLRKLLTLNPKQRITADDAMQHPYFKEGVKPKTPRFFCE
ncbi:control protein 2 homolog 1 [Seminavis robusta]|uniref:Cyclin-dependent kinase 2 homolog n=1 Tax=Seminavis robusta TaxID=568900 RepID=A0A9N8DHI7_9STRA|nr:control protein 2 homolog 1 [Seminavis robusta]|eukprot:Sro130_g062090.1 control protein 2 homolog 1 (371) ;mRNA; r:100201-101313